MKDIRTSILLFGLVLCISVGAQVRWNNVPGGAAPLFIPPNISFNQPGGNVTVTNVVVQPTVNTNSQVADRVELTTDKEGKPVTCYWYGENFFCRPR